MSEKRDEVLIYSVQHGTHDGIQDQLLFTRKSSAKQECRRLNKKLGYEHYEVAPVHVSKE